jgi:hypothetical protein
MSRKAIVTAIANLEAANMPLAHQFILLNQWNYCNFLLEEQRSLALQPTVNRQLRC